MVIGKKVFNAIGMIFLLLSSPLFAQDAYKALDPAFNQKVKNAEGRNYLTRIDPSIDPTLKFVRAWIQPLTSPQQRVTAAYMSLLTPVHARIDGIYCPDIEQILIQENTEKDVRLVPKIKNFKYPVSLERGVPFVMEPGKKRMLLIGLKRQIKEGEKLLFTFQLSSAMYNESTKGIISVELPVRKEPPPMVVHSQPNNVPSVPSNIAMGGSPYNRQAPTPIVPAIPTRPSRAGGNSTQTITH
ncbi:MAG: copper chaperone PCu(A)C [Pseudomonadota bacterium]